MIGAVTSIIFSLTVFLFQYLGFGKTFSPEQFIYHGAFLGICMLGGMIGVNLRGKKKRAVISLFFFYGYVSED
ncbi:hypothetical protein BsIDN1_47990 [Bacillus safensis]|uniref:Uncharacterized protein n=1 Tax=Bacillus safensis TaxID=561879 RepID=A0A5S9ME23_BACIA|nr:hypothetical protein BsIDN1_47990 [Bacillus safensis]